MNNNISEQIKNLRIKNGWTQAELGEKLGYSAQTISAWERGQNQPDLQAISALSKLFDVTSDQLLGIEKTTKKTPPTLSEIKTYKNAVQTQQSTTKAQINAPENSKIVDSYEQNCGESTALKLLIFIYGGLLAFIAIVALVGRGDVAFLIILFAPLVIPILDLAIVIMFFVAKEKRYSTLFWIFISLLIIANVMAIIASLNVLAQWLSTTVQIICIACDLALPFIFYPNNDNKPTFLNYIKTSKGYYIALLFQLIISIFSTEATVGYIFVFILYYPLTFVQYITLYYATKNKKTKYFYTTTRHSEQIVPIQQNNREAQNKLGSAYAGSLFTESPYAREHIMVEKPVLPTKYLLLILLLTIPVMFIIGNSVYLPDNIPLFFTIILIFFTIIPTINTLCYFIFRQGSVKLRTTLCIVYTIFNVILNLVFYEYEWNYYVPFPLVITAIWGVGAVTIVQTFMLSDHKHLSLVARTAIKVTFVFIEVIVLAILTWGYLTSDTHQIAILMLTWWQLIFFAINCTLKAPLTKKVVNYIYR